MFCFFFIFIVYRPHSIHIRSHFSHIVRWLCKMLIKRKRKKSRFDFFFFSTFYYCYKSFQVQCWCLELCSMLHSQCTVCQWFTVKLYTNVYVCMWNFDVIFSLGFWHIWYHVKSVCVDRFSAQRIIMCVHCTHCIRISKRIRKKGECLMSFYLF